MHQYLLEVYNEKVSKSSTYRILKKRGFRFRIVRETLVIQDPNYLLKKQRLRNAETEAKLDETMELLYLDEKGPIHALFYRFKNWSQTVQRIAKT